MFCKKREDNDLGTIFGITGIVSMVVGIIMGIPGIILDRRIDEISENHLSTVHFCGIIKKVFRFISECEFGWSKFIQFKRSRYGTFISKRNIS